MAKAQNDYSTRAKPRLRNAGRYRPSDDLVCLQFKVPKDFVRAFKQRALDREMKLNQLLKTLFDAA
jgi:hypothetical protein